jgi:hypothetical protein
VLDRILIVLVKNAAFVGSANINPFHFHHYLTKIVLYLNGVYHPSEPHRMDCSSPFGATRGYETLFSSTSIHQDDRAHTIRLEMFRKECYILGFDLTPDRLMRSLPRRGNVRI